MSNKEENKSAPTAKYVALANVRSGGKLYPPGAKLELTEEQAAHIAYAVKPLKPALPQSKNGGGEKGEGEKK